MDNIKRIKNKDYTTISNVFLKDKELSLKAKGFLSVVMALPDEWNFTIGGIVGLLKEGKSSVYSTIDELKEHKYCTVEKLRNEKGVIIGTGYSFYEHPYSENPDVENPYLENPYTENRDMEKEQNKEKVSPTPPIKEIKKEKDFKEDKEKINFKEKKKKNDVELPDYIASEYRDVMLEWLEYKKERRETYKSRGLKQCYDKLIKFSNGNPDIALEIIHTAMSNNYSGFFPIKNTPQQAQTTKLSPYEQQQLERQRYTAMFERRIFDNINSLDNEEETGCGRLPDDI